MEVVLTKDAGYYDRLRKQINDTLVELRAAPVEFKRGYAVCVGGILNAYREGDITFQDACKQLRMARTKEVDVDVLHEFIRKVERELSSLSPS